MTPASVVPAGMPFTKGHGTENDFVLVADPDARLTLTAETVARLCDRRAGIGADGLIRVVRTAAMPATDGRDATDRTAGVTEWFMDYRNADGSLAQMCGNGVRVMAAFALAKGLLSHDELRAGVDIGTRAGVRRVSLRADGQYSVTMGSGRLVDPDAVRRMGQDTTVLPHASQNGLPGIGVDVGNPHVVVVLAHATELDRLDLSRPPQLEPHPADGANVEFIVVQEPAEPELGYLRMRVHERGSGETRSCGTGICASVVAARELTGDEAPRWWTVDVPGGRLSVRVFDDGHLELTGPAVLVADGHMR
ncbi:MAG: diaminopimelate epimerase [Micrococcales bacterium]|nr:MAG: diaminopimelate epimerase [Micrococcales bacterium]